MNKIFFVEDQNDLVLGCYAQKEEVSFLQSIYDFIENEEQQKDSE